MRPCYVAGMYTLFETPFALLPSLSECNRATECDECHKRFNGLDIVFSRKTMDIEKVRVDRAIHERLPSWRNLGGGSLAKKR